MTEGIILYPELDKSKLKPRKCPECHKTICPVCNGEKQFLRFGKNEDCHACEGTGLHLWWLPERFKNEKYFVTLKGDNQE